jgi:hypothetical protein
MTCKVRSKLSKWYCIIFGLLFFPAVGFLIWGMVNRDTLMGVDKVPGWTKAALMATCVVFFPGLVLGSRDLIKTRWLYWVWVTLLSAMLVGGVAAYCL